MPAVRTKSGAKSQAKPSTKIMIAYPDEVLGLCDEAAGLRRLERNDIIRQTIATGLMIMQAENVSRSERGDELDFESGPRPLFKPSTKITIAFPDELLGWADAMATVRRRDRNDVIREATVLGLMLVVAENMRLSGRGDEVDAWFAERGYGPEKTQEYADHVGGIEGFLKRMRAGMAADAEKASKQA